MLLEKLNGSSPRLCDSFTLSEGETFTVADSGISGSVATSSESKETDSQRVFSVAFHQVGVHCAKNTCQDSVSGCPSKSSEFLH